jgi:hypothetical protein
MLGLSADLICGAFSLEFFVTGPFASLTFGTAFDVLNLSFHPVLVHSSSFGAIGLSNSSAARYELEYQRDDSQNQQKVDKPTKRIATNDP